MLSLDSKDLKNKVQYILENPKEVQKKSEIAQLYSLKEFSAERMIEQTLSLYYDILDLDLKKEILFKNNYQNINNKPLISIIIDDCHSSIFFNE